MTLPSRLVSLLLIYGFVVSLAPRSLAAVPPPAPAATVVTNPSLIEGVYEILSNLFTPNSKPENDESAPPDESGLHFRLSEAPEQAENRAQNKVAAASVLSQAETEGILRRLSPITAEPTDEASFALREKSLPPPRTGLTIQQAFPPPMSLAPPEEKRAGPLEVVRFSPEGEVPIAPNLSVTFSRPMVAISSQEEAAQNVPVKITPEPPGHWRWIGTKTLLFEPDVRFPMSTKYSVSVSAGTKSADGGSLPQSKAWSFTTPPPTVKKKYPEGDGTERRDPLMFAEFDQRIDPSAVLKTIRVIADRTPLPARLATNDEIESDETVRDLVKHAEKDRWIAFRAVTANGETKGALPADSGITVSIGPGTPSVEGPLTTGAAQEISFRTFGPLRLTRSMCGWVQSQHCTPYDIWSFEFTNALNAEVFQESQIRVEPAMSGLKASVAGNTLRLEGTKRPNTTYHITIDKSLRDRFDQTLGEDKTAEFQISAMPPWIGLSAQGFVVLDPTGPRQVSIYSVNYQTVKVSLYSVAPEDWIKYQTYRQLHYRNVNDAATRNAVIPGRLISSNLIDLKSTNDIIDTRIDLAPALKAGLGQVIIAVESITPVSDRYHSPMLAWVQSTQIGLDAYVDNDELVGWATSLKDGAPLGDVKMELQPARVNGVTGADGLAHLKLRPASDSVSGLLVARRGDDVAILPENPDNWWSNGFWHHKPQTDELRWFVFDDRRLYRPGEEVHLKGWIRRLGSGRGGDVGPLGAAVRRITYTVKDEAGNEVSKGILATNSFGGFDTSFKLPGTMNLGDAIVEFKGESAEKFDSLTYEHRFQVQEFRRPEFEVSAKTETEGPLFVGDFARVGVAANYFAGGGLQNAEVKWDVVSRPTNYTPPNRDGYTFGKWIPWWGSNSKSEDSNQDQLAGRTDAAGKHRLRIDFDSVKPARPQTVTAEASVTDVNRQTWSSTAAILVHPANLYVGLKSDRTFVQQGEPLIVQTIVTDLDGKAIADREVKMRAVLLDWKQIKGQWQQVEANPQDCSVRSGADAVKCSFQSKEGGVYRVRATIVDDKERSNETEFTLWVAGGKRPPNRGVEQEKVELIPDRKEYKGGDTAQILAQAPFFPADAVMTLQRSGIVRTEHFHIDGPTYTLRIPIEAAWTPNVHVQVDLVGTEDRNPASAEVPSASSKPPGSIRAGALNADGTPALPAQRPAYASGEINLPIPPFDRRLAITTTPRDKTMEPGADTVINVEAKDASGKPVSDSEVAVIVVDESVLALTNYKLTDPMSIFYAERGPGVGTFRLRPKLLLKALNPDGTDMSVNAARSSNNFVLDGVSESVSVTGRQITNLPINGRNYLGFALLRPGVAKGPDAGNEQIRLRENFNALAIFSPSVLTDANGQAQVQVKLPDNLTRYRVMAVAVAGGKQFGSGESAITARLPLMARPSAPRFLNFGDRFELPIVLQNQTDQAMTVDVAVRTTNAVLSEPPAVAGGSPSNEPGSLTINRPLPQAVLTQRGAPSGPGASSQAGRRVTVPANDRVEVRIPAAAVKAGTARFQIAAVSGRWSDAAEVHLPVWTPATTEAFATYGEIDKGAISQPVKAPANVFPQFGGLEIETSSTQLQELTDAVIYLTAYPYECSEQLSSRIITVAALRDVLTAFKSKDLPSAKEMEAAVTRDLKRLQSMQNADGGFSFWRRGDESWPYVSIHVAHALARARQKKFDVPKEIFDKSQKYLREIESHIPSYYSIDTRRAIIAYALYVRAQMGDSDPSRARNLIAEAGLDKLSLESVGWLLSVLSGDGNSTSEVTAIRHLLNNRVTETAGMAHFVCSYSDSDYLILNSSRRADGVILEALIRDLPTSDLIPKIVRGLLAHRTRGHWENTQENVFILLALDRYFNAFEKTTPDFVARAWLGQSFAGEQQFRGRSTDRQQIAVPMRYLAAQGGAQNLVLAKEGSGRLYYRIGMNYAPSDLNLKPADYGFTVVRTYEGVDDPKDVARDAGGSWLIKAGARVRVRLTMVATSRRYHVALVDPMPAGFEALNPSLAMTGNVPRDEKQTGVGQFGSRSYGYGWWWWRPQWFEHQNLRDDRAEAFTSLLWEGVYKYSYVARATTPGEFVVPPSKAEEMYHPETFGRGKTDRVRIQ